MRNKIVYQVTGKYMRMNKKRTLTTFVGIIFMILLMTCVFVGKDTAIGYLQDIGSLKEGSWHVSMYNLTKKEESRIQNLPYVAETAASASCGITRFAGSANKDRPYLNVKAYTGSCFDWMNITVTEGRLPQNRKEIIISKSALEDGAKLKVGDQIKGEYLQRSITGIDSKIEKTGFPFYNLSVRYGETISVPDNFPYFGKNSSFRENEKKTGEKASYTIVGFMESPRYEDAGSACYAAITGMTGTELAALKTFNLSMKLDLNHLPDDYEDQLQAISGDDDLDFNNYVLAFSGNSSDSTINLVVDFLTVFFTVLIMAASILLIYNLFSLSFAERSRYLGMLASVGATGRQKRSSIYYEAFFLLVFSLPLGVLSGMGVVKLGMMALKPFFGAFMGLDIYVSDCPVVLQVSLVNLAKILSISILTVLLSAWLPARKMGNIGPVECIRGNTEKKARSYKMNLSFLKLFGAEAMLALNEVKRQKKKTRAITGAAVIFMVIMTVTAFGSSSIKEVVAAKISGSETLTLNTKQMDYILSSISSDTDQMKALKKEIGEDPAVASVKEWKTGMFVGSVPASTYSKEYWNACHDIFNLYYHRELTEKEFRKRMGMYDCEVNMLSVDSKTLKELAAITGADLKKLEDPDKPAAIVIKDGEVSTDSLSVSDRTPEKYRFYHIEDMTDLKLGEKLPMKVYSYKQDEQVAIPLDIAGFADAWQLEDYVTVHSEYLWVIVNDKVGTEINRLAGVDNDGISLLSCDLQIKLNGDGKELIKKLQNLSDQSNGSMLFVKAGYTSTLADAIIGIVQVLLICFVILTSMICLMNLFNSIRGRTAGRRREFAALESVGMTRRQMEKVLFYESVYIIIKAVILTAVLVTPMIFIIGHGLMRIVGNLVLKLPIPLFAATVAITILVVVGMTLYCFRKEKQRNLLDDIRSESI